jgi:hypothetical protein
VFGRTPQHPATSNTIRSTATPLLRGSGAVGTRSPLRSSLDNTDLASRTREQAPQQQQPGTARNKHEEQGDLHNDLQLLRSSLRAVNLAAATAADVADFPASSSQGQASLDGSQSTGADDEQAGLAADAVEVGFASS